MTATNCARTMYSEYILQPTKHTPGLILHDTKLYLTLEVGLPYSWISVRCKCISHTLSVLLAVKFDNTLHLNLLIVRMKKVSPADPATCFCLPDPPKNEAMHVHGRYL